jgi:hypothetical protein
MKILLSILLTLSCLDTFACSFNKQKMSLRLTHHSDDIKSFKKVTKNVGKKVKGTFIFHKFNKDFNLLQIKDSTIKIDSIKYENNAYFKRTTIKLNPEVLKELILIAADDRDFSKNETIQEFVSELENMTDFNPWRMLVEAKYDYGSLSGHNSYSNIRIYHPHQPENYLNFSFKLHRKVNCE